MAVNTGAVPWTFTAAADVDDINGPIPLGKIVCYNGSGVAASFVVKDGASGRTLFAPVSVPNGEDAERDFPNGTRVQGIYIDTIPGSSTVYVYPQVPA